MAFKKKTSLVRCFFVCVFIIIIEYINLWPTYAIFSEFLLDFH